MNEWKRKRDRYRGWGWVRSLLMSVFYFCCVVHYCCCYCCRFEVDPKCIMAKAPSLLISSNADILLRLLLIHSELSIPKAVYFNRMKNATLGWWVCHGLKVTLANIWYCSRDALAFCSSTLRNFIQAFSFIWFDYFFFRYVLDIIFVFLFN